MPTLEFWCELASTYTYLAASRIESLAEERGVPVTWRPFSLGPAFAASGWKTSPFNLYPDKGRYMWRDVEREAGALGIPFRKPSVFPRNTIPALRVAIVGAEREWGPAFLQAVLRANFGEDRDIADPDVIDSLLAELGLDGKATREEAESPEWKPKLRAQTERAGSLGIFGSPTFLVEGEMEGEMFWGNDRLELAIEWARRPRGGAMKRACRELRAKGVWYLSQGDERSFFYWLERIPCVGKLGGVGDTLSIAIHDDLVDEDALRELIALFHRYEVDLKQLAAFENAVNSAWLRKPEAYWFKQMFGSQEQSRP